jgi:hypothetical protein
MLTGRDFIAARHEFQQKLLRLAHVWPHAAPLTVERKSSIIGQAR